MSSATATGRTLRAVIIGGGIAGLSAAWYLEKQAAASNTALEYTVMERDERWGGKILTDTIGDFTDVPFVVEGGPDSFLTQKPWALQLARELSLDDQLLGTNDAKRNVYVLNQGKPVMLPDGVQLIVPTKFMPFIRSPLISPLGKLRMGLDLLIPGRQDDGDETLAEFVRRRLGNEALTKIADPLMSGIYNAEADKQSIMATFPRFRAIEKEYGSLTRGMLAARRKRRQTSSPENDQRVAAFMSFQHGTNVLIEALVAQLRGELRLNTAVDSIERNDNSYAVQLANGEKQHADIVIVATPAFIAAKLLGDVAPQSVALLNTIRYVSTGTLSLAFKKSDISRPLDGFGMVIPGSEQRPINAITISSTKFHNRAPDDYVLMRVFFGGSRSPQSMALDDESLVQTVRDELRSLLGVTAEPLFHRIYRWWNANPQYDLGHIDRVNAIEAALPPGIHVTGSPYRGVGMPDCVHHAQQVAHNALQSFIEQVATT